MSTPALDVSIVVCTYNRADFLRDALASLQRLATDGNVRHEIVVVDNASTDDTGRVIEEAARDSPVPLRGVHEVRPGVACARNRGVCEARAPWIAFFDDDQVADPQWLNELLAVAREKGVRCVGGGSRLRLPPGGPYTLAPECRGLLGGSEEGRLSGRYDRRRIPATNNLLLHRSVFEEVGLFDESLREAGEDSDLYRRMHAARIEGWYTHKAFSYHVVPPYRLTEAYWCWKARRNGGHLARRDRHERGRVAFLLLLAARLGQALFLHVPRLLWAQLRRAEAQVQQMRCLLWRSEGYVRYALSFLAPRLFAQRGFFARMEFRAEREMFAAANLPAQAPVSGAGG
jgi:glycosyltransferase involved in cell wall biosynthesis